jgi:hypothetical protein
MQMHMQYTQHNTLQYIPIEKNQSFLFKSFSWNNAAVTVVHFCLHLLELLVVLVVATQTQLLYCKEVNMRLAIFCNLQSSPETSFLLIPTIWCSMVSLVLINIMFCTSASSKYCVNYFVSLLLYTCWLLTDFWEQPLKWTLVCWPLVFFCDGSDIGFFMLIADTPASCLLTGEILVAILELNRVSDASLL